MEKTFVFERNRPALAVRWKITNRGGAPLRVRFASELNLSLLAGDADDRYFEIEKIHGEAGTRLVTFVARGLIA